jgi:hypothetical protein
MKRLVSTALAVALLLSLGALAVLARSGGDILSPPDNVVVAAAQPQTSAALGAPPTGGKYNVIALALDNGLSLASELVNDVNATTDATALQALKWDPDSGWAVYDPSDQYPEDFSLLVGDAVMLRMQGSTSTVYSLVGDVPAQGSVNFTLVGATPACKYNYISLPLDQGAITLASELAADIGDVARILEWNPDSGYAVYDPSDTYPEDFTVRIGYPYMVCMTNTEAKTWPSTSIP